MTSPNKLLGACTVLVVAGIIGAPCRSAAEALKKTEGTSSATGKVAQRSTTSPRVARRSVKGSSKRRRRSRRHPLAQLRLEPERVKEIQGALAQAGYLRAEPNGTWDEPTRDAMRRYQADHGFPTTGLPESKTLMKLGLGPHPLPTAVDSQASPRANFQPHAKTLPAR